MKRIEKFFILTAIFALLSQLGTGVAAAAENGDTWPIEIHVMSMEERNAFEQQDDYSRIIGTAYLTHNNETGTNGSVCADFVAKQSDVAFVAFNVPGAVDYNVQLYSGLPGEGKSVSNYATVGVNNGVYFSGLTVGENYYFKVSSNTLSTYACTALYSLYQ